uniref:Aldo_ket_red domain-containing protein n=2 Tax=Globodera pallida TaxID=36090 RepID=A0A183C6Q9_GLOPA
MSGSYADNDDEESWVRDFPRHYSGMEIEQLDEFHILHQTVCARVVPCCVDAEITEIATIAVDKMNTDRISHGMATLKLVQIVHATKQQVSGRLFRLQILFKQTNYKNSNSECDNDSSSSPIYSFFILRKSTSVIDIRYEELASFADVPGGRWRLLSGNFMPKIGFQCSPSWGELEAEQWILIAFEAGFRLFDLTFFSHNRGQISKAIKKYLPWFGLSRTDVFISAKINIVRPQTAEQLFIATRDIDKSKFHSVSDYAHFCVAQCVEQFDGYIDLCMVHYPRDIFKEVSNMCSKNREDRAAVYGVLEHYFDIGIIRSIGTANFEADHVEHLVRDGHRMPAVVQCEMHPFLQREDLLDYCKSKGIFLQAHSIFAYKDQTPSHAAQLKRYALLKRVSSLYQISTSQLSLRYIMQCSPQVGAVVVEQPDDLYAELTRVMLYRKLRDVLTNLVHSVDNNNNNNNIQLGAKHMFTIKGLDLGKFGGRFTECEQWKVL